MNFSQQSDNVILIKIHTSAAALIKTNILFITDMQEK